MMQPDHTQNLSGGGSALGAAAQAIVTTYRQILRPLPPSLSALVRPLIAHHSAMFGGRDAELAALDAFLASPNHPFGLLVAPAGIGKTTLLVHWLARVQRKQPRWRIVFAPISIRYQTAGEQTALSLLAYGLASLHDDLDCLLTYDQSPDILRDIITVYLSYPLPARTKALVVLDGIDEATGWTVGPLCAVIPQSGLKIVLSARQQANADRNDWRRHVGWDAVNVKFFDLHPLKQPAIAALLRQSGSPIVAYANNPAFVEQFYRVSAGDPLTANLLIKALISGQIEPESLHQRPRGLEAFLKDWLETLRARKGEAIEALVRLCAAAYGPLSASDVQALAPAFFSTQNAIADAVNNDPVARFVITAGDHTYAFCHQRLREVLLEQISSPNDHKQLQQQVIKDGESWYATRNQPLPDYLRQYWVKHLAAAGQWEKLRHVLTEMMPSAGGDRFIQPWQTARFAVEGSAAGYLSDLDVLWRYAEDQGDLGIMLRCALIEASLRSRKHHLQPELLVQLVKVGTPEGRWSAAAALEVIAQMPDAALQAACLKALLDHSVNLPWKQALEVARAIDEDGWRAAALTALAHHLSPTDREEALAEALAAIRAAKKANDAVRKYNQDYRANPAANRTAATTDDHAQSLTNLDPLPPHLLAEALAAATAISDQDARTRALAALIPYLPPAEQDAIRAESLAITRAITRHSFRIRALVSLAPHLLADAQAQALDTALTTALAIDDDGLRSYALAQIVHRLSPDLLAKALLTVRSSTGNRAATLAVLAPFLPITEQDAVLTEVLTATRFIDNELWRAQVLTRLAPLLPDRLLAKALAVATSIDSKQYRFMTLTALAPRLSPNLLAEAIIAALDFNDEQSRTWVLTTFCPSIAPDRLIEALEIAHAITAEQSRREMIATPMPPLPPAEPMKLLAEALAAAKAIPIVPNRDRALSNIALYLLPDRLDEALAITNAITNEYIRSSVLITCARYLRPNDQMTLLAEILATVRAMTDANMRADLLIELAPHLPPTEREEALAEALVAAHAIIEAEQRANVLTNLVAHLPPADRAEALAGALDAATTHTEHRARTKTLTALAPQLAATHRHNTALFAQTLRRLARHGRPPLLDDLAALAPWIAALGEHHRQPAVAALAQAIIATGQCWG